MLSLRAFFQFALFVTAAATFTAQAAPRASVKAIAADTSNMARIVLFSPQHEARTVRQVQARFSEDMIPFGDPRRTDPFTVQCPKPGKGRWVDTRNWAYDFDADLPSGISCTFTLVKDSKSLAGKTIFNSSSYQFNTGGPLISDSMPRAGISYSNESQLFLIKRNKSFGLGIVHRDDGISESPHFLLKLDGEVNLQTIEKNTYCLTEGLNEKIPVHLLTPAEVDGYLKTAYSWEVDWWNNNDPSWMNTILRAPVSKVIVECKRHFANKARVTVVWGRGIASTSGIANTQEQLLGYKVRPEFLAHFSCSREGPQKPCNPLANMVVEFTEDIDADTLQNLTLRVGKEIRTPAPNSNGDSYDDSRYAVFSPPFPANSALTLILPPKIKGIRSLRPLKNAARFPLSIKTGDWPPLAKFAADFGIVEAQVGAIPLTLRNLEPSVSHESTSAQLMTLRLPDDDVGLINWIKTTETFENRPWRVPAENPDDSQQVTVTTPVKTPHIDPRSESLIKAQAGVETSPLPKQLGAKDFEVIGIPVNKTGVYLHEVESTYLGQSLMMLDKPMYTHSMSLVTDLAVHFKRGRVNSLVWVTSLAHASPIANAHVEVHDCHAGELLWQGETDNSGIARIERTLPNISRSDWLEDEGDKGLKQRQACRGASMLISARLGEDRGFVLSNWTEGIDTWRYNLGNYYYGSNDSEQVSVHSVLDRSLFRPNDTVHMRHFIRAHSLTGFSAPDNQADSITIRHNGSNQEYTLPVTFDRQGNANSEWKIPAAAKLGTYSIEISLDNGSKRQSGEFRVAQFRLPLLKAQLQLPAGPIARQETMPADMSLAYVNGGIFPNAKVLLRGLVSEDYAYFPDYDLYSFRTCVSEEGEDLCPPLSGFEESQSLEEIDTTLDAHGGGRADIPLPERVNPANVQLEMEFQDPSGETQTVAANSQYWPASWLAGIKVEQWLKTGSKVPVDVIVLDTQGHVVKNAPVKVDIFENKTITTREKTVGGFYSYDNSTSLENLNAHCEGKSDATGRFHCEIAVDSSGELRLRATVTDKDDKKSTSSTSAWVSNDEPWWFDQQDTDRIDLIPEKKSYNPNQTMRFQVRMPFQEATVLVTTEREGILDAQVQHLSSKSPVITLPAKGSYAPNVFVSALAIRGRNNDVQPTAYIDLGKPAFKLGITEVKVGWNNFKLNVDVRSDKKRYRIREQAKVHVRVNNAQGQALPVGTEVTLAVVDEALLELAANNSWDLLTAMMNERGLEVDTATSQIQVVGKRHFGRKALPAGGGGGKGGTTRELFDTLVYWQARATVNERGEADFNFPLNDSVTGFRLVAIASSTERFGKGEASIQTFQDLQVISGLPPIVREGDVVNAGFTVRNASNRLQKVSFSADAPALSVPTWQQRLELKPNESRLLTWPVTIPNGIKQVDWTLSVASKLATDRIKVSQRVLTPVPEQIIQATLTQLDAGTPFTLAVEKPADALSGGGINIQLKAHLNDGLDGVQRYFRNYPYACLEQQISRAIALDDKEAWQIIGENIAAYLDDQGFAKIFSSLDHGDPLMTAYLLEITHENGWQLPATAQEQMLNALDAFVDGRLTPTVWNFNALDNDTRKLKAMSVLASYHRFKLASIGSLNIQPSLWPTAMLLDWFNLLQHEPTIPQQATLLEDVSSILRSRLNLQGTALILSRNENNQWWLYNSTDVAAVRLFLAAQTLKDWQDDLPRLIRGLNLRAINGHWDTTLANAWASVAMKRFSERFEKTPVSGTTQLQLANDQQTVAWPDAEASKPRLEWPTNMATLKVNHEGTGKPWLMLQSVARIPITKAWSTGYKISKETYPIVQKVAGQWSVGDVMLVMLHMDAQTDMNWVAVDDPIPAGASLLGRGLDRDSALLDNKGLGTASWANSWHSPDFAEYLQDSYRGYYSRVDKGSFGVAYVVRLNQAGTFRLPPTRVEAMYAPEMFGLLPNDDMVIKP